MKEAYYFSHDSNARHDPKIIAMRSVYEEKGYGWYWIIIEIIREQAEFRLPIDGKYDYQTIAKECNTDAKTIKQFIDDCVNEFTDGENKGLFLTDGKYIWSDSLLNRMALRQKRQEAGYQGGRVKGLLKEDKKIDDSEFVKVFEFWNVSKIIVHAEAKNIYKDAYTKARKNWTAKEICSAISNYSTVIHDSGSYFKYKWTFDVFMISKKAISQFVIPESLTNYKDQVGVKDENKVIDYGRGNKKDMSSIKDVFKKIAGEENAETKM